MLFYRRLFRTLHSASEEDLGLRPPPRVHIPHQEDADGSFIRSAGLIGVPLASAQSSLKPNQVKL